MTGLGHLRVYRSDLLNLRVAKWTTIWKTALFKPWQSFAAFGVVFLDHEQQRGQA